MAEEKRMDKIVALCKRRGFVFQSSEIYGGINGFWDYGPLGVELKKNIKDAWWEDMVRNPPPGPDGQEISMVGVDCALIMNPKVWEASGHVGGFSDPMVDDKQTKERFRADHLYGIYLSEIDPAGPNFKAQVSQFEQHADENVDLLPRATCAASSELEARDFFVENKSRIIKDAKLAWKDVRAGNVTAQVYIHDKAGRASIGVIRQIGEKRLKQRIDHIPSPATQQSGTLTEPRMFNLMFRTFIGAVEDASSVAYLRPETAQGIFVNFRNVLDSTRLKLPFGIAQVGKAFRNDINPRNYTFRSREFEQMEIEFFCHPADSMKWYQYWCDVRIKWYTQLGIKSDRLRPRPQTPEERAHYSVGTTDIEYLFPFSEERQELEGVAHRSDYDLKAHMQHSGKDLSYFEEDAWNALLEQRLQPFKDDKKRRDEEKKKLEQAEKSKYSFVP